MPEENSVLIGILNEVLSLNAQESLALKRAVVHRAILNEVLSLNAQESARLNKAVMLSGRSSMKS